MQQQPPSGAPAAHAPPVLIWQGTPSWKAFFWRFVGLALLELAAVAGTVAWMVTGSGSRNVALIGLGAVSLFCLVVWLYLFLKLKSEAYKITSARIEWERGIFSKRIDGMELWRVHDIGFHQSLLDRIVGVAQIHLWSQDKTDPEVCLFGLPPGRKLYDELTAAISTARQERGMFRAIE
jgi:membrane protein YdbS with pleckstrin-like domain